MSIGDAYKKEIKSGIIVDIYDVLVAFEVTNPALQHCIKKLLCPGRRHQKTKRQDLLEAEVALKRAIELEENSNEH